MIKCLINDRPYALFEGLYEDADLRKMSRDKQLICPQCGNPYSYCHGKIKVPYFRHIHNFACVDPEPETEEHILGKTKLYKYIQQFPEVETIDLETYISSQELRPDITFTANGKKYAVEYQCSPIATEYEERHEKYKKAGIKDIWICGTEKYLGVNKRMNHLEGITRLYFDSKYDRFYMYNELPEDLFLKVKADYPKVQEEPIRWLNHNTLGFSNIKDWHLSCYSYNRWPSPTGRPSNKYPYPVKEWAYSKNLSVGTVIQPEDMPLKYLMEREVKECQE